MTLVEDLQPYSCSKCRVDVVGRDGQLSESPGFVATSCGHILCGNCLAKAGGNQQELPRCTADGCQSPLEQTYYPLGPEMIPEIASYFASPVSSLRTIVAAIEFQKQLLDSQTRFLKTKCRSQMETIKQLRSDLAAAQADQRLLAELKQENAQLKAELDRRGTPSLRMQDLPQPPAGASAIIDNDHQRSYIATSRGTKRRAADNDHAQPPLIRPSMPAPRLMTPARVTLPPHAAIHNGPLLSSTSSSQRPVSSKEHIAQFAYDPNRTRRSDENDAPPSHHLNQYFQPPPQPGPSTAYRRSTAIIPQSFHPPSQRTPSNNFTARPSASRSQFRPAAMPMPSTSSAVRAKPLSTSNKLGAPNGGFRAASSLGHR